VCDEDCGDRTVDQVMHAPLTIDPAAPLRQAVDLMIKHRVHRLVVADPGNPDALPLGVISTSDLFAEMARPGSVWLPEG
jgi:CBS domain-containing protein